MGFAVSPQKIIMYQIVIKVSGKSVINQIKFVEYSIIIILFCYSRTCLLSPEMFPKGDTHKQLFQLMLTMQGREIISSVLVGI